MVDKKVISPKEFAKDMERIVADKDWDREVMHELMDDLMCDVLKSLGYRSGVEVFLDTDKWYA